MYNKKKMMMSKLVDRIPRTDWRLQSRGMVIQTEVKTFAKKMRENFVTLLITVIGMATALTWSDVVGTVVNVFFADRSTLTVKIFVALTVTVVTLTLTYIVSRVSRNGK